MRHARPPAWFREKLSCWFLLLVIIPLWGKHSSLNTFIHFRNGHLHHGEGRQRPGRSNKCISHNKFTFNIWIPCPFLLWILRLLQSVWQRIPFDNHLLEHMSYHRIEFIILFAECWTKSDKGPERFNFSSDDKCNLTWQRINAWNREDMWSTEALDCSAKPAMITWMWSAMWHDASWGIGWQWQCEVECVAWLAPPCRAVCVSEPRSIHDRRRIWPTQSMNSRGLEWN